MSARKKSNPILEAALALAAEGKRVFPCKPSDKSPLTIHGFRDATTDEKQIRQWFGGNHPPMIGLPTGTATELFVIDLDDKNGKTGSPDLIRIAEGRTIPRCPRATTPSGGHHLFFRLPRGMTVRNRTGLGGTYENPQGGIDVRGIGGYVCVAPSVMEDGRTYEWTTPLLGSEIPAPPEWIARLVGMRTVGEQEALDRGEGEFEIGDGRLMADDPFTAVEALNAIPCHKITDYNQWIAIAHMFKAAIGADGFDIFFDWCKSYKGNSRQVVRGKWDSIHTSRVGAEHLFGWARNFGWSDPTIAECFDAEPLPALTPDELEVARLRKRPSIRVGNRDTAEIVDEALGALSKAKQGVYQFGSRLVVPGIENRIVASGDRVPMRVLTEVELHYLERCFEKSARFVHVRVKQGVAANTIVPCPPKVAGQALAMPGWPMLPQLTGFTSCPIIRADGTILDQPGYDAQTGLLYLPDGTRYAPVKRKPTKADAVAALDVLLKPITTIPYVGDDGDIARGKPSMSRSVALSAMLSPLARFAVENTPLHAFTAPRPAECKSMHPDISHEMIEGRPSPAYTAGRSEEELTKTLKAALKTGEAILNLNNMLVPLGANDLLLSALTDNVGGELSFREFQVLDIVRVPGNRVIMANGVNLAIEFDMIRRTLLCRIDSRTERPEAEHFGFNPRTLAHEMRAELIHAGLTILRWHYINGNHEPRGRAIANFEKWSAFVRGAIVALGEPDPVATQDGIRANDQARTIEARLLAAWRESIGIGKWSSPGDIVNGDHEPVVAVLREAVEQASKGKTGLSATSAGNWLSGHNAMVRDGFRLHGEKDKKNGGMRWIVEPVISA